MINKKYEISDDNNYYYQQYINNNNNKLVQTNQMWWRFQSFHLISQNISTLSNDRISSKLLNVINNNNQIGSHLIHAGDTKYQSRFEYERSHCLIINSIWSESSMYFIFIAQIVYCTMYKAPSIHLFTVWLHMCFNYVRGTFLWCSPHSTNTSWQNNYNW